MDRQDRLLVVHGYEIVEGNKPGTLCESVCWAAAQLHEKYDRILLVAGQHLPGATQTVDQVMKSRMVDLGAPIEKLIAWSDPGACPTQRPPRTTMEEVDLLPSLLRSLGYSPRCKPFDVACIDYYKKVVQFLYRHRRAKVGSYVLASDYGDNISRWLTSFVTYGVTRLWPTGRGPIYEKIRSTRDIFPLQPNGCPWNDNLPLSWEDSIR